MHWSRYVLWGIAGAVILWGIGYPSALLSQSPGVSTPNQGLPSPNQTAGGQLQMVATMLPTGTQQIVVLDSSQRSLAVYHVDNGNLQLRSVRSLVWDLRMEEFNGTPPLPSELRRVQP